MKEEDWEEVGGARCALCLLLLLRVYEEASPAARRSDRIFFTKSLLAFSSSGKFLYTKSPKSAGASSTGRPLKSEADAGPPSLDFFKLPDDGAFSSVGTFDVRPLPSK